MAKKRRFESLKTYFSRRSRERQNETLRLAVETLEDRVMLAILGIDLNGSDQAGIDYATTFTEDSPPVLVQDTDMTVTASGTTFGPMGSEFQVNTTTAGSQALHDHRAIAADAAGNFVVVWSSPDGGDNGVYGQRFDATGAPLGGEFQVNTFSSGEQLYQAVAMDGVGNFVVVWSSQNQDGSGWGVYGQRYNATGAPVGGEFQVNTRIGNDQYLPSAAMDSVGNFVVVWESVGDGSASGIYGQRYDATGAAVGGEFLVNTFTSNSQRFASVAMNGVGDFVVSWMSFLQDGSGWGIYAQCFNSVGAKIGSEIPVNTFSSGNQQFPSAAMDDGGNFAVIWQSEGQDGTDWSVQGQRFDATGSPIGGEFQVNTFGIGEQNYPSVAMDSVGNFVAVWTSYPQDGSGEGVYGQRYDATGVKVGGEFRINTTTNSTQNLPSVAMDGIGNFVVVWRSLDQDGSSWGVFGQRYGSGFGGSSEIDEAMVTITNPLDTASELLAVDTSGTGIIASYGNGAFTLSGTDTPEHYQQVLRTVTYDNSSQNPNTSDRIIEFVVGSGQLQSDIATTTLSINSVNDAPEFTSSDTTSVPENSTAVLTLTINDVDSSADDVSLSVYGGSDESFFEIVNGNELKFRNPPDFETPLDADENNIYSVQVQADDGNGGIATQTIEVTVLNLASITGTVFVDVNQDGQYDANEPGINGVAVQLLNSDGTAVLETATTSDGGFFLFEDLDAATYQLHQIQPSGVTDGAEILGSLGGTIVANDTMQLNLASTDASDYSFAEIGGQVTSGDTATIGFWQNKHGQELIDAGGADLATWLTTNFTNVFGNVFDATSVADFYKTNLFKQKSKKSAGPAKVDAQFMAVALATYFTSDSLAGTVAADYGFNVTDTGIGTKIVNVGANGAAFDVADGSDLTIMQLLLATDSLTDRDDDLSGAANVYDTNGDGVIDAAEAALRAMANEVYSSINETGDI